MVMVKPKTQSPYLPAWTGGNATRRAVESYVPRPLRGGTSGRQARTPRLPSYRKGGSAFVFLAEGKPMKDRLTVS
jgi:hypothetical protein